MRLDHVYFKNSGIYYLKLFVRPEVSLPDERLYYQNYDDNILSQTLCQTGGFIAGRTALLPKLRRQHIIANSLSDRRFHCRTNGSTTKTTTTTYYRKLFVRQEVSLPDERLYYQNYDDNILSQTLCQTGGFIAGRTALLPKLRRQHIIANSLSDRRFHCRTNGSTTKTTTTTYYRKLFVRQEVSLPD